MVKNNSKSLKKFISIFLTALVFIFLIGGVISNLNGFQLKDVIFIEGIVVLMIGIFSSIGGSQKSLDIKEFVIVNPQCFANITLGPNGIIKERTTNNSNLQINIDLVSTSIIVGAIIALISSYLL
ncbi:hypothetical protein R0131_07150 [Clostridium sp. AL.422]|uniref:hypothetical protein n=1 Tax=Clostridium TaxID=1485 RepID=UPI00293DF578|nr:MULTISPECIES: hypothetical protein [unclassified Clostridium]MDV4150610.1 hypothetical protein [Clostridium sp. AL.422]